VERVRTGIEPLDFGIPEGIPRTSTIIIAGAAGTGKSVFLVHIAKNFMERGEKVVYLTLDDSPKAILEMLGYSTFLLRLLIVMGLRIQVYWLLTLLMS